MHDASIEGRSLFSKRSPLTRAAFSNPRLATACPDPLPLIHRPFSDYIPRNTEHPVKVHFEEVDTMSEDARSIANSETSEVTTNGGGRKRRRSSRTSTAFTIAHPAPTLTHKQRLLQVRPRLLLQLQRLSPNSRPKPILDVVPSTFVVLRLVKRFPRAFRGKGELGHNDVMVVKSEAYDTPEGQAAEESDSDSEGLASRDLIAVICQLPKDEGGSHGRAEIVLGDGSIWVATPLPNGSYEFTKTLESGEKLTARWVKRTTPRNAGDLAAPNSTNNDTKFTFSMIDPNSRRHPILGSITQKTLDIPDFYTTVTPLSGRLPPASPIRVRHGEVETGPSAQLSTERTTYPIDDNTKTLIQITGIWVSLREGWCPYFKYNDTMSYGPSPGNSRVASHGRVRSLSLTPDASKPSPAGTRSSTPESSQSTFGVVGDVLRRTCAKNSGVSSPPPQFDWGVVPKRATSTGTAFMQRATARKIGNPPSTVPSDSEGEGHVDHPKRAVTESFLGNSLSMGSSSTLDTPTKPQRRAQSTYIPTSALQNGHVYDDGARRASSDAQNGSSSSPKRAAKPKSARWKAFTNFFRRNARTA